MLLHNQELSVDKSELLTATMGISLSYEEVRHPFYNLQLACLSLQDSAYCRFTGSIPSSSYRRFTGRKSTSELQAGILTTTHIRRNNY